MLRTLQTYTRQVKKIYPLNTRFRYTTSAIEEDVHRIPPQLNLQYYAEHTESIAENMKLRNYEPDCVYNVKSLYDEKAKLQTTADSFREARDQVNKSIRLAKSKEEREVYIGKAKHWKDQLRQLKRNLLKWNQILLIRRCLSQTIQILTHPLALKSMLSC
ncbi:unnamed protein product [Rhizopus stolonifer]